ncbi:MAG: cupin domain-containing protein [Terriglobales bacterium]
MPNSPDFPYTINLDARFPSLTLMDVSQVAAEVTEKFCNQTLCQVNGSVIRLSVMHGDYHWHKHDHGDEFFFVVGGHFVVDLEGRSVDLGPQQGFVVPKGVLHRTRAPERAVILVVETAEIVPTGD